MVKGIFTTSYGIFKTTGNAIQTTFEICKFGHFLMKKTHHYYKKNYKPTKTKKTKQEINGVPTIVEVNSTELQPKNDIKLNSQVLHHIWQTTKGIGITAYGLFEITSDIVYASKWFCSKLFC